MSEACLDQTYSDLAEIYGYTTKAFNQQVKNNIEKFDEDFMFQLSEDEVGELSRSKILTLKQDDLNLKSKFLTSSLGSEYDSSRSKKKTSLSLHRARRIHANDCPQRRTCHKTK